MNNSMLLLQYKALDRKIDPNQSGGFMRSLWHHVPNHYILFDNVYGQMRFQPQFSIENLMAEHGTLYYRVPFTCGPVTVACVHHPLIRFQTNCKIRPMNDIQKNFIALTGEIITVLMNYERGKWNGTEVFKNLLAEDEYEYDFDDEYQAAWLELYRNAEKG